MKKNVLFISQSLPNVVCGVGDHIYFIIKHLRKYPNLLSIKILTSNSENISSKFYSAFVSEKVDKWSFFNLFLKLYNDKDIDIIHYQYPIKYPVSRSLFFRLVPISFFLRIFIKKNIYLTIHEFYKLNFFLKILKLFEITFCDRVFVVTYIDECFLKKIFKNKIKFIPVGSNIPAHKDLESKKRTKSFKIVFFGFIDKSKGVENILDIISRLLISNQDVSFTLIGQFVNEKYKHHIFSVINRLELNKNIEHIPYVPTKLLSKQLTNFDLAFLPFKDGVAPNRSSAIACLYAQLPIMTTYKDIVTPKYFKHMENCILTKFNDQQTMYDCIKILINDSDLYSKLKKGSYELTKKFDWKQTAEILKAEYLKSE